MNNTSKSLIKVDEELKKVKGISPSEQARIRSRVTSIVSRHLNTVDKVLEGEVEWSSAQVNLFKTLINKLVADMPAPKEEVDEAQKTLGELTPEEFTRKLEDATSLYLNRVEEARIINEENQ